MPQKLLNTGHTRTVHANSAAQGISRFTTCVLQSGVELPYRAIQANIAESVNVVLHLERRPGKRFVSEVLELDSAKQNGFDSPPGRDEDKWAQPQTI